MNNFLSNGWQKIPPTLHEPLRFIVVGGTAALVHLVILVSLVQGLQFKATLANALAFLGAFVISFLGHFYITFRPARHATPHLQKQSLLASLPKWLFSSLLGFGLNQLLFSLGIAAFGEPYYIPIWFVATALVTLLSFGLGKIWAFR